MSKTGKRQITYAAAAALVALIVGGSFLSTQFASGQSRSPWQMMPHDGMPMMGHERGQWMGRGRPSMIRHHYYMRNGLSPDYRDKINALSPTPKSVAEGALLYTDNCASCHGARGLGDGEAGRDLNPPPANIAHMIGMPMFNVAYLFWTVSEGGAPVGSAMPAFKDVLSDEEIWKIIAAMRAGFPAPAKSE